MPQKRKAIAGGGKRKPTGRVPKPASAEPEEEEAEPEVGSVGEGGYDDGDDGIMMFSQQPPELPQPTAKERQNERENLNKLNATTREQVVMDLSRTLLFKALQGDPIDRPKAIKDALGDKTKERISSAVFNEAERRLRDVFGFDLRRVPKYMERTLPKKYSDRLFVVNVLDDVSPEVSATHSRSLHSVHTDASVDRGLLMMILAFAHCKGDFRGGHRWISAEALYRLLSGVDENVPDEPPSSRTKGSVAGMGSPSKSSSRFRCVAEEDMEGPNATPDVDSALERFVHGDYLLRGRVSKFGGADSHASQTAAQAARGGGAAAGEEGTTVEYAMGPRSAMEIGRRQVVYFLAEVLDEDPDPTMLAEIEDEEEQNREEGEDEEEGERTTKRSRLNADK